MGWLTSLMVLVGLIYSLIGTLCVIYFCYLMFHHGFKWAWRQMFARTWENHKLRRKVMTALKKRKAKLMAIPNPGMEVKLKDPIKVNTIYSGVQIRREDLEEVPADLYAVIQEQMMHPERYRREDDDAIREPSRDE